LGAIFNVTGKVLISGAVLGVNLAAKLPSMFVTIGAATLARAAGVVGGVISVADIVLTWACDNDTLEGFKKLQR
jgi:multisubunit Na+/H+ antiporter MnhG subunit